MLQTTFLALPATCSPQIQVNIAANYEQAHRFVKAHRNLHLIDDIDLASYEPRGRSMQVILGIEGAKQRQVLKQVDVLMLLYILRRSAFVHPPAMSFDRHALQANWEYYVPRTDHTYGSSLGLPVHAILACDLGKPEEAYEHFLRSALVDLADVRSNAAEVIERLGILGRFDAIADGNSAAKSKPVPDVFLHAAAQLGLEPHTCVVIEDATSGIEAALRAGMWTVGLGPKERVGDAQVVLPSLVGFRWTDILARLTQLMQPNQQNLTIQQLVQRSKVHL